MYRCGLAHGICGGLRMDPRIRELVLLTMTASVCAWCALSVDEGMFALVFAVEAAWAGVEAAFLS